MPIILFLSGILLLTCSACGEQDSPSQSEVLPFSSITYQEEALPESEAPDEPESPSEESPLTENGESQGSGTVLPAADSQPDSQEAPTISVDVDLTTLSSTMVYAEVFNMTMSPDDYIGKIIRMTGIFTVYQDPETKQVYCGVIVQDATACCAQGFDIVMPENAVYPQDYPPAESEVTVVGELQVDRSMEEYGLIFLRLENVTFE